MYIARKQRNGKTHYYLRESLRKSGRVMTRDIAHLGSDPKKIMEKLHSLDQFKKEIKKSMRSLQRTVDFERYLERARSVRFRQSDLLSQEPLIEIEAAHLHFKDFLKNHDFRTREDIFRNFSFDYTWHSSSMEGNTITLPGATRYFNEKLIPKNATESEVYDLRNGQEAGMHILMNYQDIRINKKYIIELHKQLMKDIDIRTRYRTFEVRTLGSRKKRSLSTYIDEDMDELFAWIKRKKKTIHPFILACIFHIRFEDIHPFADGNGRTGRLLFNLMLLKAGYPPFIIRKKTRSEYLDSLESSQSKDYYLLDQKTMKPAIEYFAGELKSTYWNCFE